MASKKILYIITNGDSGGAQTHLFDLCTHLDEKYTPLVAVGEKGPLQEKLGQAGITVFAVPSLGRKINLILDLRALFELRKLINQLQPDLVCTHSSKAGFLGRLAARWAGIPALFTAHGWAFTPGVPSAQRIFYRSLERLAARWTERIICVSDYDFELALHQRVADGEKMVTIHNGISVSEFPKERVNTGDKIKMIMVARFSQQKDQPLLIKALSQINVDWPFELYLVGDGPLLQTSRDLAADLNIMDKVSFLGDRSDVADLLSQADIFVLASKWEGLPITILEAMRAGLPVIASDVGGCRELIIEGQTGFLVKRADVSQLAHWLAELIADRALRVSLGRAGYVFFTHNFTIEQMVQKTLSIYDNVLQSPEHER